MKIVVDATEPGLIFGRLRQRATEKGFDVTRTWLHKREGRAAAQRERTPFYGSGVDYVIADPCDIPLVSVERKTCHDLARSSTLESSDQNEPRIFRQARDLAASPLPILILEGDATVLFKAVEAKLSGLQFWLIRQGISILYTSEPRATADAIFLMARKLHTELFASGQPNG